MLLEQGRDAHLESGLWAQGFKVWGLESAQSRAYSFLRLSKGIRRDVIELYMSP